MTGQIIAAIIVGLAALPIGWLVRREAQRAKSSRDLDAALAQLARACDAAALALGTALLPALRGVADSSAGLVALWRQITDGATA